MMQPKTTMFQYTEVPESEHLMYTVDELSVRVQRAILKKRDELILSVVHAKLGKDVSDWEKQNRCHMVFNDDKSITLCIDNQPELVMYPITAHSKTENFTNMFGMDFEYQIINPEENNDEK